MVMAVPTGITPVNNATVTSDRPVFGGTLAAATGGRTSYIIWEYATTSNFTGNSRTAFYSDPVISGTASKATVSRLKSNGIWYLRAFASSAQDGESSAYTATTTFTLNTPAPPAPTGIYPLSGSTQSMSFPILAATISASLTSGGLQSVEWQFATDAGFTANVRTVLGVTQSAGPSTIWDTYKGTALTQGLWYVRARTSDPEVANAVPSAWSAANSFSVSHVPNITGQWPTGANMVTYGATNVFSWTFTDTDSTDTQSAYQIVLERNDTNALVLDTGKVISTLHSANLAIGVANKATTLRWKIKVWDRDNVVSVYSNYHLFTARDAPVVNSTYPTAGGTVDSSRPTFTWTATPGSGATITQYRLTIQINTGTGSGAIVYDSDIVAGSVLLHVPSLPILVNGGSYYINIVVWNNYGLMGSDTHAFTAVYVAPAAIVTTIADLYVTAGYMDIDWTQIQADISFTSWRVYRKEVNDISWTLLLETANVNTVTYHDWKALVGYTYQYAVTQVADRSGSLLESSINNAATLYTMSVGYYWLLNPNDESKNFLLYTVTSDSYTKEIEQETFTIIGRGRKTNYGTSLGKSGSLSATIRDKPGITARQQRLKIEAMQEDRETYLLRNPFGDILQVSIGNIQIERLAGVGSSEFCTVSIPYTEVV